MRFYSRAQAGLEYLMTYGWALVLIVTVASVLFFVFSPNTGQSANFSLSNNKQILLKAGNVASDGTTKILTQNASGGTITITNVQPSGSISGSTPTINNSAIGTGLKINSGQQMEIAGLTANCTGPITGNITITFTDKDGYTKTAVIQANGKCAGGSVPCSVPSNCGSDTCKIYACTSGVCSSTNKTCGTNGDGCCPTGCTILNDTDCPKLGNGQACGTNSSLCQSAQCIDGVCCNNSWCASNLCGYCDATGTCIARSTGDDTEFGQACMSCQGMSSPAAPNGTADTAGSYTCPGTGGPQGWLCYQYNSGNNAMCAPSQPQLYDLYPPSTYGVNVDCSTNLLICTSSPDACNGQSCNGYMSLSCRCSNSNTYVATSPYSIDCTTVCSNNSSSCVIVAGSYPRLKCYKY